ncbi:MAG: undecaprenyl-phosphate glucose phosphotransferase [Pseudomonadota bacterium]
MFKKSIFKSYSGILVLFSRFLDPIVVLFTAYISFLYKFNDVPAFNIQDYKLLIFLVFLCVLLVFPLFDLYNSWRGQTLLKQAKAIFLAWSTVVMILIITLFSLKLSADYSRLWLGYWAVSCLMLLLFLRMAMYGFLQYQRTKGKNIRRVIVVGAGDLGLKAVKAVSGSHWAGYAVSAIFDDNIDKLNLECCGCKVEGDLGSINNYLIKHQIDEIWLALPLRSELKMKKLLNDINHHPINIKLIPDIFGFALLHHSMTEIAGLPAVNLSVSPMDGSNQLIKEIEDRMLALIILILISPIMLLIALGVKMSSPGPILFKQDRVSWNGKIFKILKFRSMPVNDEQTAKWGNAQIKETTKFGRFIRKTSLDELPQFINVLTGKMSIVGPRPERTQFVDKFKYEIPGYMQKHMVKAGITGWAQINGLRGDTCISTRVEYDLYYIENWSLWFDLKIIFITVLKGFVNKNAY